MTMHDAASLHHAPRVRMATTIRASGLGFTEGPCVDTDGSLFFVEMSKRRVSVLRAGRVSTWVRLPGSPNGAAFGPDRHLYVCDGGGRWPPYPSTGGMPGPGDQPGLVWRISPDGVPSVLVGEIDGIALNGANDLCFDDQGGMYFTDPEWETGGTADGIRRGSICYALPSGGARRVHSGLRFPNGLHVTPDGGALVVGETDTGLVHRFPILRPGVVGEPSVYAELAPDSSPDGMCFDALGRLIVTASTGGCLYVIAPEGGSIEQVIESADPCPTNACFGGPGHRTLFVTEGGHGRVVSLEWDVPGMVLFPDRDVLHHDER